MVKVSQIVSIKREGREREGRTDGEGGRDGGRGREERRTQGGRKGTYAVLACVLLMLT